MLGAPGVAGPRGSGVWCWNDSPSIAEFDPSLRLLRDTIVVDQLRA